MVMKMRVVLQIVQNAHVDIDGKTVGSIKKVIFFWSDFKKAMMKAF